MPQLLTVENLAVSYGAGLGAVEGVSLSVEEGSVHVILGSNGAGKTSVLRGISGFWRGESGRVVGGRVQFAGTNVTRKSPRTTASRGVVLVPEDRKVFTQLTVEDNLRAVPHVGDRSARADVMSKVLDLFPVLAQRKHQPAGFLSGGERQLLGIGRALLLRPRLLLIDEASLGLSPIAIEAVFAGLNEVVTIFGTTLLVVEQNVGAALDIATQVHLLEAGRMIFSGSPDEVLRSERIRAVYLGVSNSSESA